jgi:two-component system, chemotaxis family, protein-glutamate methylesterase/glutaminase
VSDRDPDRPLRILICDDSLVVRKLAQRELSQDPRFEVVGAASGGVQALALLAEHPVDAMILDIEMPEMSGLEVLRLVRDRHPDVRVIMFSTETRRAARITLDALAAGASDYVTKPGMSSGSADVVWANLKRRINALFPRRRRRIARAVREPASTPPPRRAAVERERPRRVRATPPPPRGTPLPSRGTPTPAPISRTPTRRAARTSVGPPRIALIGSSTGGPQALTALFQQIERPLRVPVLVVQHMPPVFTACLADRLAQVTGQVVREAVDGEPVQPGEVLIAPGGFHMRVKGSTNALRVTLDQSPEVNYVRPAVDVLLDSALPLIGGRAMVAILTGMGRDGAAGAGRFGEQGATVFAQDQESSVVWGMPGHTAETGYAHLKTPAEIGAWMARHLG